MSHVVTTPSFSKFRKHNISQKKRFETQSQNVCLHRYSNEENYIFDTMEMVKYIVKVDSDFERHIH